MVAPSNKPIVDVAGVVRALGGPKRFSVRAGCSRTSPYNYITRGSFPREVAATVLALCSEDKLAVPISIFDGMTERVVKLIGEARLSRVRKTR